MQGHRWHTRHSTNVCMCASVRCPLPMEEGCSPVRGKGRTETHHYVEEEPGVSQDDLPVADILMIQHPCPCNLLVQQLRGRRREGGKGREGEGRGGEGIEGEGIEGDEEEG